MKAKQQRDNSHQPRAAVRQLPSPFDKLKEGVPKFDSLHKEVANEVRIAMWRLLWEDLNK